jgi:FKBP-type peptidyl-prolyl cis-trans isomerase SlyD
MRVGPGTFVTLEFEIFDEADKLLDSSSNSGPLNYIHGLKGLIPEVESVLEGKDVGEHFSLHLNSEKRIGNRNEEAVKVIPKKYFKAPDLLSIGQHYIFYWKGVPVRGVITSIHEDQVIVDGNHPFAGKHVRLDIHIKDVRQATEEEKVTAKSSS